MALHTDYATGCRKLAILRRLSARFCPRTDRLGSASMAVKTAPSRGNVLKGLAGLRVAAAAGGIEGRQAGVIGSVWAAVLLAILAFLVIYPVLTLLLGALTDTNPVVEGLNLRNLSVGNFLTVLSNPNVAEALFNTLIACGGGTAIAVVIGLLFSWIVVRTNT